MNPDANQHFTGELSSPFRPHVKRVVVHGRAWDGQEWGVVYTELIPDTSGDDVWGGSWHGATLRLDSAETLMWGGKTVKVPLLPIVSHGGVRQEFPGWVVVGTRGERGKIHVGKYDYADVTTPYEVFCGRKMDVTGGMDASWYMGDRASCRDCQKVLREMINEL